MAIECDDRGDCRLLLLLSARRSLFLQMLAGAHVETRKNLFLASCSPTPSAAFQLSEG
jgi:hypothetical protein